jgi:transposase-like protein
MADVPDPEVPLRATRRRFTAAYKLRIVEAYDAATEPGAKGALLRREGLYSSHIVGWRNARDAGALAGLDRARGRKPADPRESELARLRRRAERAEAELARARLIIDVQGKVSALLDGLSESADPPKPSKNSKP